MKRRSLFLIKLYMAIAFFAAITYILTFQQDHWLTNYFAYNLNNSSDHYPDMERYVALLLPTAPQLEQEVDARGFRRFLMPIEGDIIASFNEEINSQQVSYRLDGVIFQCQPGSDVIAGDDGVISEVHFYKGVGWYMDIYHGNGIYSRYANLTTIKKEKGEKVSRGEKIAKIADSFNGKFYLQLFIEGKAVNPVTATLIKKGI